MLKDKVYVKKKNTFIYLTQNIQMDGIIILRKGATLKWYTVNVSVGEGNMGRNIERRVKGSRN